MVGNIEIILGIIIVFYAINRKFRDKVNGYVKRFFSKKTPKA
jgi:hypothetical protein